MATTTTNYGFPKPTDTDLFQPNTDISNLADSVDNKLKSQVADKLQRVATSLSALNGTTGNFVGQIATVTSDGTAFLNGDYRWSGSKWERASKWVAATKALLLTSVSASIPAAGLGRTAVVTSDGTSSNNGDYVWLGSSWGKIISFVPEVPGVPAGKTPIVKFVNGSVEFVGNWSTVVFATPFPTACLGAVVTPAYGQAVTGNVLDLKNFQKASFDMRSSGQGSGAFAFTYVAWGY